MDGSTSSRPNRSGGSAKPASRDFVLSETMDGQGRSTGVRINGKGYAEPVTERVERGATKTWRFIDAAAFLRGQIVPIGRPRPVLPQEDGWKDTAVVFPREILTIRARFDGFTGRYVFHCHMLEHEDNDMMRPYEVVAKKDESPA